MSSSKKITAIIQARYASSRLPGKILLPLGNKTVLEQVIDRVQKAKYIDQVIVATSNHASNQPLLTFLESHQISFFAGSENDVLDRYFQTAKKFSLQHICRVTADCPLIDTTVIDQVAKEYLQNEFDYVANNHPRATYPDGFDTEIFSFKALQKARQEATLSSEREHVTPYIWKNPKKFDLYNVISPIDYSSYRITLDEPHDYDVIKEIYAELPNPEMSELIDFLKTHPRIRNKNAHIGRDEGYQKSLHQDVNIKNSKMVKE
jgi:spore coat polysaccharide biosynthesis protein SpsF